MTDVRVRIAPSPTGAPHVGTAYIALFNLVFAKVNQGKFILRIEDTDQTRSRKVYETAVLDALKWVGLSWDEGPDVGGKYGPYRQSERTEIYRKYAEQLVEEGKAYRCFCTPEMLEQLRKDQKPIKTNNIYRDADEKTIQDKLEKNEPYTIRLKVPEEGECVISDRFREEVRYNYSEVDDQIILKSDGFPTYHLANVVDDHLMKISHVIRGEEWLTSTPKHVLLYEYLGWEKPEFIHMPLLKNPDGSKLSKRKNPTSIFYYREAGFLPEALLNYLSLMGYSRPNGEEKFSLEEMIVDFDINRVSLGGSVFDLQKLSWLSGKYIREDLTPQQLAKKLVAWRINEEFIAQLMPLVSERMDTLGDFMPLASFFWSRDVEYTSETVLPKKKEAKETAELLQVLLFAFEEQEEWLADQISISIRAIAQIHEWKIREITHPLFVAISGKKVAPPLFDSMEYLGKDICRVRIVKAMETLGGVSKKRLQKLDSLWKKSMKGQFEEQVLEIQKPSD